jgi:peptidoglycan/xylan/chitin deacetylase (PgdA/CDA1 family)
MERAILPILYGAQLHRLAGWLTAADVTIAMYHGFTAATSHPGIENHEQKHLPLAALERQLAFLKAQHSVVPLADVVRALATGASLPRRAAAITIDDGYQSVYRVAYPVLKRLGLPASVYLATGFVDERRFLWTDRVEYAVNHAQPGDLVVKVGENALRLTLNGRDSRIAADRLLRSRIKALPQAELVQAVDAVERAAGCSVTDAASEVHEPMRWSEAAEMQSSGLITFGSHTHSHVILSRCDAAHATRELEQSRDTIENRLGVPCREFCYPNGRVGDFNATTGRLVRDAGFTSALTTVYGRNRPNTNPFELRRYNLGKPMVWGEVPVRMSGLMDLGGAFRASARESTPHY